MCQANDCRRIVLLCGGALYVEICWKINYNKYFSIGKLINKSIHWLVSYNNRNENCSTTVVETYFLNV